MKTYLVTEWNENNDAVRYHHVRIDPDVKGGTYRQLVSIQTFQERMQQHTQQWDGEKFLGYRNLSDRFSIQDPMLSRFTEKEDGVPTIEHANLWVFYKYIGYDHTKSRLKGKPLEKNKR